MDQHAHLVDRIETALRDTPFCGACGAHTSIVEREGGLWLSCSQLGAATDGIGGTLKRLVPHDLRPLVERDEVAEIGPRYATSARPSSSRLAG
jgi:hypothetical protein